MTIEIDNLHYAWKRRSDFQLNIAELKIAHGEKVFLYGPSGSGKSTLLSLLGGVLLPQQGRIRILGKELTSLSSVARDRFRADHVGFLFQQFNLLPYLSVIDNILLPCRFSKLRCQRALQTETSLEKSAIRLLSQLQLDTGLIHQKVTELSVGQQQRVAAARAMIGQPELIIADEPTSALDSDRQVAFLDLLLAQCAASNASLLMVSHDRRLATRFSQTLAMHDLCAGVNPTMPFSS
ncbi:MAG: ABC transporter ATP-binding protein [Methylococcaceae bacterium]|nr:ABC transporter ATP-binding protein [Methylococcaceae bacterium]